MSVYRMILAAVAAMVIAAPVYAEDSSASTQDNSGTPAIQTSENSSDAQSTASTAGEAAMGTKVNLNTASASDLMKIKGISRSKAKAIVSYRKKNGNFKQVDDLAQVKGFKNLSAEKLKGITDQLIVE